MTVLVHPIPSESKNSISKLAVTKDNINYATITYSYAMEIMVHDLSNHIIYTIPRSTSPSRTTSKHMTQCYNRPNFGATMKEISIEQLNFIISEFLRGVVPTLPNTVLLDPSSIE